MKDKPVLPKDTEQELVEGLKDGQEDSQRKFFNQYYEGILRYLLYSGKARCQEDAEDITSETFSRVFRDIKGFKGRSSLKTWLFRIVDHAGIDFYRLSRNKYDTASLKENIQINESTAPTYLSSEQRFSDPIADIVKKEEREKVQECLQQLREEHRMVITLRLIEGCSVKETAQIMQRTEGAIKMLFFRAWEKFTKIVREHPYFIDYHRNRKGGDLR